MLFVNPHRNIFQFYNLLPDFNVLENKEKSIRGYMNNRSKNKLMKELKKGICLCSNCHRRLHHEERLKIKEGFAEIIEEHRLVV